MAEKKRVVRKRRLGIAKEAGKLVMTDASGIEIGRTPATARALRSLCKMLLSEKREHPLSTVTNLSGAPLCGMADRGVCGESWTKSLCESTLGEIAGEDGG